MVMVGEYLRELRDRAVRDIVATSDEHRGDALEDAHAIDAAHDRLRELEDAMRDLEEGARSGTDGRTEVIVTTGVMVWAAPRDGPTR